MNTHYAVITFSGDPAGEHPDEDLRGQPPSLTCIACGPEAFCWEQLAGWTGTHPLRMWEDAEVLARDADLVRARTAVALGTVPPMDAPASTQTTRVRLVVEPCELVSVHDADTFRVRLPLDALWPEMQGGAVADVRLAHVNAAELSTSQGKAAAVTVEGWLVARAPVCLSIYGRDKYGRVLADAQSAVSPDGMLSDYVRALPGSVPMAASAQLAPPLR